MLLTLLMKFWDPSTVTFKFLDFKITLICLSSKCEGFLKTLGFAHLSITEEREKVKLDYFFRSIGRLESFDKYHEEFVCSQRHLYFIELVGLKGVQLYACLSIACECKQISHDIHQNSQVGQIY